jgi:glycosyltransferase involved in cell wall biosynthesis
MLFGIDSHGAEREGEGNATYTRNLVAALLAAAGADEGLILFAADPGHPFYASLPLGRRSRVVRVPQGRGLLRLGWSLARAASRHRVEGLHVQYTAPVGYRGPLVVTVHDLGFLHLPDAFPPALRLALRVLVPRSVARASRIIAVSEFVRRDIIARYGLPPARVTTIPEGAAACFRPRPRAEVAPVLARYGLEPGFVFSVGRLNRRKNLGRLIRAHARLGAVGAPLVIGGKPDYRYRDAIRAAARPAGTAAVRWVGLIPDEDLPFFYAGAACFAYPSLFEGFGLPVLEAMACGAPVVTSNRTALPELVDDAGLLVDPESVEALAGAMRRLLADPALAAELGRRGLERSRRFSWPEAARRTAEVYREIAAR